jgi:hypothetical protein
MIKVYDDASNISMSLADATATKTGAIRLDSSFAAGDGVWGLVQEWTTTIDLATDPNAGSFTAGTITVSRIGKVVTFHGTSTFTHGSASSVSSSANLLPSWALPVAIAYNVYVLSSDMGRILINTDGSITTGYFDYFGATSNRINSIVGPLVTYTF